MLTISLATKMATFRYLNLSYSWEIARHCRGKAAPCLHENRIIDALKRLHIAFLQPNVTSQMVLDFLTQVHGCENVLPCLTTEAWYKGYLEPRFQTCGWHCNSWCRASVLKVYSGRGRTAEVDRPGNHRVKQAYSSFVGVD